MEKEGGEGGWTLCKEGQNVSGSNGMASWHWAVQLRPLLEGPYQKCLARSCQDISRFGKLARNLFQIYANFWNLQESSLSCKILFQNPCKNLVLLDLLPDSCKILKRSCQGSFQNLGKIFFIGGPVVKLAIHYLFTPLPSQKRGYMDMKFASLSCS